LERENGIRDTIDGDRCKRLPNDTCLLVAVINRRQSREESSLVYQLDLTEHGNTGKRRHGYFWHLDVSSMPVSTNSRFL